MLNERNEFAHVKHVNNSIQYMIYEVQLSAAYIQTSA